MRKREHVAQIHAPIVRRRTIIEKERGAVAAFCVQLEFNRYPGSGSDDRWQYIARFDHNPSTAIGHDITEEGLHMDLHHPVAEDRVAKGFPPVPICDAPHFAERFFDENYLKICERYIGWCDEENPAWRAILPLSP